MHLAPLILIVKIYLFIQIFTAITMCKKNYCKNYSFFNKINLPLFVSFLIKFVKCMNKKIQEILLLIKLIKY